MFKHYKPRERVIFHDENQCEVKGVVIQEDEYEDRLVLLIELDDNAGHYQATVMKVKFNQGILLKKKE